VSILIKKRTLLTPKLLKTITLHMPSSEYNLNSQ